MGVIHMGMLCDLLAYALARLSETHMPVPIKLPNSLCTWRYEDDEDSLEQHR